MSIRLTPFLILLTAATAANAALTTDFEVFPADVNLKSARDRQSLVVRITEPNGVHRDVTAEAKFTIADPYEGEDREGHRCSPSRTARRS